MPETPTPPTAGRYDLIEEIARGGTGVVYRATDTTFGREVAVKVLAGRFGPDPAAAQQVPDGARIVGRLQHPGIPAVFEIGALPDGRPFLAMPLIRGRTLEDLLARHEADRGRLVAAFEQACQAVGYAHHRGVVHRDLKPSHVMVGAFGEVQVLDWMRAAEGADPREDVSALGAVLCAVLTGRPPGGDPSSRLDACGADPVLIALCQWCLSPAPADRPADAGAVACEVARLRADAVTRAAGRRRWPLAVVAFLAFGCGCLVTWLYLMR